ncbi:MAG: protein TolR [Deltaproteobacteria bacterium]|nr:protein TolR [Deltaproteobacteria bacterium]
MEARRKERRLMSQINVTPLVDVMLVLLIIFMVTAPMMQAGIDVNLPKVDASAVDANEEPLVVTVDRNKRVYINEKSFKPSELSAKLSAIHRTNKDKMVLLRADETVPYGVVMETMSEIRKAGIEKVGMVTEPVAGGR